MVPEIVTLNCAMVGHCATFGSTAGKPDGNRLAVLFCTSIDAATLDEICTPRMKLLKGPGLPGLSVMLIDATLPV